MKIDELPTPTAIIDLDALNRNIDAMSVVRPGQSLRSHVKAHKCTDLARHSALRSGSMAFCCATLREMEGMVRAGLGDDLLLANETLQGDRLGHLAVAVAENNGIITVAIDSTETLDAARKANAKAPVSVLIDVNVGLPRCGVAPDAAGALADRARAAGLEVRGVMGYEGHVVGNPDRNWRTEQVALSMALLQQAHDDVGGDVTSSGGTGTFDLHSGATEVQAGSYLLMDSHYAHLNLPFEQALTILATVISVNSAENFAVANAGLKCFGMDHGEPAVVGHTMLFTSDEHATFVPLSPVVVGQHVQMLPAHIDPTMALHERAYVVSGDDVVDSWPIDLRNW